MADHTKPESAAILPAKTWAGFVDEEDAKSIRSEAESSTASLTASIFEYRTLHGRTYHSDRGGSQYWGTNDERQNESLDINHHACTLLLGGKLHLAPLEEEKVKNALDVGTGTGNWAMDFASEYPSAQVIGTDLSPVQPTWIPPNLTFQIDDFNLEWTFAPNHFDYIHTRWLVGTSADWNKFYSQAFHHLAPGGWFETHEMSAIIESDDGSVTPTSALGQWGSIFISGGQEMGIPFTIIQDGTQKKGMEAAGFVDIQEKNFKMPIGDWPRDPDMKEIGLFSRAVLEGDPEGYVLFMTHSLGWSRDEILAYIQAVRKQVRGRKSRPFYRQRVVWGRKPE